LWSPKKINYASGVHDRLQKRVKTAIVEISAEGQNQTGTLEYREFEKEKMISTFFFSSES
jgi:hypothetical protein